MQLHSYNNLKEQFIFLFLILIFFAELFFIPAYIALFRQRFEESMESQYLLIKSSYFVCVEVFILPVLLGVMAEILTLRVFYTTFRERFELSSSFTSQGLVSLILHWLIGECVCVCVINSSSVCYNASF